MRSRTIFNLNNLSDIPESIKSGLKINMANNNKTKVLGLFSLKNKLTKSEILIGFYRLHKKELGKPYLSTILTQLLKEGSISHSGDRGVYQKSVPAAKKPIDDKRNIKKVVDGHKNDKKTNKANTKNHKNDQPIQASKSKSKKVGAV